MANPKYRVSLKLPDKTYTKLANTIAEGLVKVFALHDAPYFKTRVVIKVSAKKQKAEALLPPVIMRKLLVNPLSRLLLEKRLLNSLK